MESPKESANLYKIGTKKLGLNDDYYYVLNDKNKKKIWVKEGCLFVIYKIDSNSNKKNWTYEKLIDDWEYIGGGTTYSSKQIFNSKIKYPREEQFIGNPKYTNKMKDKLRNIFEKLKDQKIVKQYKIVSTKQLQNYINKINS